MMLPRIKMDGWQLLRLMQENGPGLRTNDGCLRQDAWMARNCLQISGLHIKAFLLHPGKMVGAWTVRIWYISVAVLNVVLCGIAIYNFVHRNN